MTIMVLLNIYHSSHIVRLANNTDEWETMKDDDGKYWQVLFAIQNIMTLPVQTIKSDQ